MVWLGRENKKPDSVESGSAGEGDVVFAIYARCAWVPLCRAVVIHQARLAEAMTASVLVARRLDTKFTGGLMRTDRERRKQEF